MAIPHLEQFYQEQRIPGEYFRDYSRYLLHLLANLDFEIIEDVAELIITKGKKGRTVYIIGNGGSATTASHFATDLAHCCYINHRPIIKAISLAENIALLTAMMNDRGVEGVFSRQVQNLLQQEDILIAISASGNSPNILAAVKEAKRLGGHTVGISGFDGGELTTLCDYTIHVRTAKGEYGPVEDTHLFLDHMITSYIGIRLKHEANDKKKTK